LGTGFLALKLNDITILALINLFWYFSAKKTELYDEFRISRFYAEVFRLLNNITLQILFLIIITFAVSRLQDYRLFVITYGSIAFVILAVQKYAYRQFFIYLRFKGKNLRYLVIIGAGEIGQKFYRTIQDNPHFGYKVVGFVDDNPNITNKEIYLGSIEDFLSKIDQYSYVDELVVALPNSVNGKLNQLIEVANNNPIRVKIIPDYFKLVSSRYRVDMFGAFPMITIREEPLDQLHNQVLKRIIDIGFSIFLFITVFSWLFPIIALLIKLDSSGPVFFIQERWGRNNKPIKCYKFRSMVKSSTDLDENGEYKQASKIDSRITRFGSFLRKSNLDELPQFINVFLGNMSVVGPRPHPTPLNIQSKNQIDNYLLRHLVKPGITGWAQVNGFRGETKEIRLMKKRVQYDIYYIEHWSPLLDLKIVFLTAWNMIKGEKNAY
jgi:putative colanic acid biosynthesis UDP-glucose lipid carrier transferase